VHVLVQKLLDLLDHQVRLALAVAWLALLLSRMITFVQLKPRIHHLFPLLILTLITISALLIARLLLRCQLKVMTISVLLMMMTMDLMKTLLQPGP